MWYLCLPLRRPGTLCYHINLSDLVWGCQVHIRHLPQAKASFVSEYSFILLSHLYPFTLAVPQVAFFSLAVAAAP